jgi:hypothetical protein
MFLHDVRLVLVLVLSVALIVVAHWWLEWIV